MQSKERGKIDEAESWRVRLREEQEKILPATSGLQVHGQALHDARAQGQGIAFYHFHLFFQYSMAKTLRFYWQSDCDACEELKPAFKEVAQLKGWRYKEINIDKCKSKICNDLEYVPTVYIGRKKLDLKEMDKLLDE